jgi:membrane-bound serine protease (ClpP class)
MFWAIILIAVGLGLVFLELFIPSAGTIGIAAAILILLGIVLAFMVDLKTGAAVLLGVVLAVPALLAFMIKIWPNTPIGKLILLKNLTADDVLPNTSHYTQTRELLGQLGIAKTKMIPSGTVVINDRKVDAICTGFAIEPGQPVKVVSIKNNRVYVQPYDGEIDNLSDMPVRDRDILARPIEELGIESLDDPLE